jgi:hypothetical protein
MKALALALMLALSVPARAEAPVELRAGDPAPYDGALCDRDCAAQIVARIDAANALRDRCYGELQEKPSAAPTAAAVVIALVVGVAVGGLVVAVAK